MNESFWKRFPPLPGFDCLKMKHDIQSEIYEDIKNMTAAERLEYFRRGAAAFRAAHPRHSTLAVLEDRSPYGEAQA